MIRDRVAAVRPVLGDVPLVLHLHDTRGLGLANVFAALEAGVTRFDTSLAGMGGCPFIEGATGNIATEDTAYLCDQLGVATGVDGRRVAEASARIEDVLGKTFPGKLHRLYHRENEQAPA
jgi:hydroxymethylglutaryl-CoA lyase